MEFEARRLQNSQWNEYLQLLGTHFSQNSRQETFQQYKLKQQVVKRKDMKVWNFTELQSRKLMKNLQRSSRNIQKLNIDDPEKEEYQHYLYRISSFQQGRTDPISKCIKRLTTLRVIRIKFKKSELTERSLKDLTNSLKRLKRLDTVILDFSGAHERRKHHNERTLNSFLKVLKRFVSLKIINFNMKG